MFSACCLIFFPQVLSLRRFVLSLPFNETNRLPQMEQIKRANRMYTNDSIFLKKSLSIPVLSDFEQAQGEAEPEDMAGVLDEGRGNASELSPMEFLKRLDGLIDESKQAAVGCQRDAERRSVKHLPVGAITAHPATFPMLPLVC